MTYSDNEEGKWIDIDPFSFTKLHDAGYAVGGYEDDDGTTRYVLYRMKRGEEFTKVHDFANLEDLQLMAKLLIDGGM